MLGLAAGLKQLDNHHAATAAWTRMSVRHGYVFIDLGGVWLYGRGEHVASRLGFGRTGRQAVVADSVEALDTAEGLV